MKNIIIFAEMGAGKSTVAEIIAGIYGHRILSLGEVIHQQCKLYGHETREEMQKYGQAMRDIFGQNIWCDYVNNKIDKLNSKYSFNCTAIDDARQLNEYDYFVSKGFIPVGVIANENSRLERLKKRVDYVVNKETDQHETEVQARQNIDKCEIIIENNGSIEELRTQITDKLDRILLR